jgi:hypothetical protein
MIQKLEVYDPPMCCPTGVCGPFVDATLVHFAADIDWLKDQGVNVERYNLAQQPDAFAGNTLLQQEMEKDGTDCLPLIIANGRIVARGNYPDRKALARFAGIQSE